MAVRSRIVLAGVSGTVVILLVLMLTRKYGSHQNGMEWPHNMHEQLLLIQSSYYGWESALGKAGFRDGDIRGLSEPEFLRRFAEAPPEAFAEAALQAQQIRAGLRELWRLSGLCAFSDIPPDRLVDRTPTVMERYQLFLDTNIDKPRREILRSAITHDIEMLRTPYWTMALDVLQSHVWFDGIVSCTGTPNIGPDDKKRIFELMSSWLRENETSLQWNEEWRTFTPLGQNRPFEMPVALGQLIVPTTATSK